MLWGWPRWRLGNFTTALPQARPRSLSDRVSQILCARDGDCEEVPGDGRSWHNQRPNKGLLRSEGSSANPLSSNKIVSWAPYPRRLYGGIRLYQFRFRTHSHERLRRIQPNNSSGKVSNPTCRWIPVRLAMLSKHLQDFWCQLQRPLAQ